ncbi:unnamed protein product, partial [Brassica oleracea]
VYVELAFRDSHGVLLKPSVPCSTNFFMLGIKLAVVLILVIAILRRISNQLSVVIDVPGEDESYHLQPRLFGKIVPAKCRYEVLSTKVEIRLAKAEIITWASLEHGKGLAVLPKPNFLSEVSKRPAYPSSKKVKDWDTFEAEVKKQEKGGKLEGDAALNKSLREIYSNADEDMRRAMSKSFNTKTTCGYFILLGYENNWKKKLRTVPTVQKPTLKKSDKLVTSSVLEG